ncbi:MAG: methionine adenosyltransferase [Rikenellaceae bacterium]
MNYLFTSESVSAGHPDKLADQISDAILDSYLLQDPHAKVACETLCTTDLVVVAGEVKANAQVDAQAIVRKTIEEIGYNDLSIGFDAKSCKITNLIHEQSSDIRQGVERAEQGAGDQGIMFGYAVRETSQYIPATLALSNLLLQELDAIRREGEVMTYLRPDAKSQVTIEYCGYGAPIRVDTIVISTQHDESVTVDRIKQDIINYLLPRVKAQDADLAALMRDGFGLLVNPTGRFVIGGPNGDTGLTGRKIIVDTYGGRSAHGGGAFSGKDPSKVDRSAAYMARYIAKNLVASGIADEVQVQLAYAIGVADPISVMVNTFNTANVELIDAEIAELVVELFDLRPASIIEQLQLKNPIYLPTASYGHFGREPYVEDGLLYFGWERTDMVEQIQTAIKKRV